MNSDNEVCVGCKCVFPITEIVWDSNGNPRCFDCYFEAWTVGEIETDSAGTEKQSKGESNG